MKIILSPSKTMNPSRSNFLTDKELLFPSEHKKILQVLQAMSKEEVSSAFSIKGSLLDKTIQNIQNYPISEEYHAFESYTGLVFTNIEKEKYQQNDYQYIEQHLYILDAFYGILEPGTLIKPYRLDMKVKIGIDLYKLWNINAVLQDDLIINLASKEFSKMISQPMITIQFLQQKKHRYVNQATYSKQARGLFFDYCVKNKVEDIEDLKSFKEENYAFNSDLSDEFNIVYTR